MDQRYQPFKLVCYLKTVWCFYDFLVPSILSPYAISAVTLLRPGLHASAPREARGAQWWMDGSDLVETGWDQRCKSLVPSNKCLVFQFGKQHFLMFDVLYGFLMIYLQIYMEENFASFDRTQNVKDVGVWDVKMWRVGQLSSNCFFGFATCELSKRSMETKAWNGHDSQCVSIPNVYLGHFYRYL